MLQVAALEWLYLMLCACVAQQASSIRYYLSSIMVQRY